MATHSFRHLASFGKRMEFTIIAEMLAEGMDVYTPLIDDNGIDAVVRKSDGSFVEVQIKTRSADVNLGDEALFAGISHDFRPNYWFIFRSEGIKDKSGKSTTWILSSNEFIREALQNKSGKNIGKRTLWFNGKRKGIPYAKERYEKYRIKYELGENLTTRLLNKDPNETT
jgi:hypothetical protein